MTIRRTFVKKLSKPTRVIIAAIVLVAGTVASSEMALADTSNWVVRTPTDENLLWQSVAYGNGTFVAVGFKTSSVNSKTVVESQIMSSRDGVTWTSRVPAEGTNEWRSVAFGNDVFVAVSSCARAQAWMYQDPCDQRTSPVMTSTDGITWVGRATDKKDDWWRVAWGSEGFVAVSRIATTTGSNQAMTSTDGITWTYRTMPSDSWDSVSFGAGKYVAVGTNKIAYSSDGALWTAATNIDTASFKSVAYGPAGFVALAGGFNNESDKMMNSTDGVAWAPGTAPASRDWRSVTYGDGGYVAVGAAGIMTSTDLGSWTMVTGQPMLDTGQAANSSTWESITFGSGMYAAVASQGPRLMTSGTFVAAPGAPSITTVTAGDGQLSVAFTAPASNGGAAITDYEVSTDGGSSFTSAGTTTSPIVITGLTNGTTYSVLIKARNSAGLGAASETVAATPATANTSGSTDESTSGSTGNTAGGSTSGSAPNTTAAPTTTTVPPVADVVPGVTVTDTKVYTKSVPKKVAEGSAIAVLTPAQAKTRDVKSLTPKVCLPANDDLVFIKTGRCVAQVVSERTGAVLRTLRTRVVEDEVSELNVGNAIVTLTPIYFGGASASVDARAKKRLQSIKDRVSAAGTVLIVGHSGILMGNTPENQEMGRSRAIATRNELRKMGAKGPFYFTSAGALDPATTRMTQAAQARNRRVVIVLIP
jgi:outer membrane protein OmpA-like peptidoglycan-associated protein